VGDGADITKHSPQKDEDEEGDDMVMPDFEAAESLNRGTDKTTEVIDATLKDVSPRYVMNAVKLKITLKRVYCLKAGFRQVLELPP